MLPPPQKRKKMCGASWEGFWLTEEERVQVVTETMSAYDLAMAQGFQHLM